MCGSRVLAVLNEYGGRSRRLVSLGPQTHVKPLRGSRMPVRVRRPEVLLRQTSRQVRRERSRLVSVSSRPPASLCTSTSHPLGQKAWLCSCWWLARRHVLRPGTEPSRWSWPMWPSSTHSQRADLSAAEGALELDFCHLGATLDPLLPGFVVKLFLRSPTRSSVRTETASAS